VINWIKKHWPLVWKSTLEQSEREWRTLNDTVHEHWDKSVQLLKDRLAMATAERDAAVQALNETQASRDAAEAKALGFQRRFAELVPPNHRGHLAVMPWTQAYVTTWTTDAQCEVRSSTVAARAVTASINVAMDSDTPPELVAVDLGVLVADAVLKEYQKQSILGDR
jgi:hypothetical protein